MTPTTDDPTPIPLHPAAVEAGARAHYFRLFASEADGGTASMGWPSWENTTDTVRACSVDAVLPILTAAYEADPTIGALRAVAEAAKEHLATSDKLAAPDTDDKRADVDAEGEASARLHNALMAQLRAVEER